MARCQRYPGSPPPPYCGAGGAAGSAAEGTAEKEDSGSVTVGAARDGTKETTGALELPARNDGCAERSKTGKACWAGSEAETTRATNSAKTRRFICVP